MKYWFMDIKVDPNTVLVFDLDDTMYKEIDFLRSAYTQIAKKIDPENWRYLFAKMFSLYRCKEDVFKFVSMTYGIEKEKLIDTYRNHYPDIQPAEGLLDLLRKIKDKKGKLAVITDGRTTTQMAKIKALGIIGFFEKIVVSENLGTEKPNENNYLTVENYFKGRDYYYVADNLKKDFIAPNTLGWQTICLLDNGLNIHCDAHLYMEPEFRPKNFIVSLAEIRPV